MSQDRPEYEVVDGFNVLANQIIKKYPQVFYGVNIDTVRCVKITNKDRPEKRDKMWDLIPVKMPIAMDSPYAYYIVLYATDWDALPVNLRLVLISEILHGLPKDEESEGKVIPPDVKGYGAMFRTFKTIDYLSESSTPNILETDVVWVTGKNLEQQQEQEAADYEQEQKQATVNQ